VSDLLAELQADNTSISMVQLTIYADALRAYAEAAENVTRLGAIVKHPRTGAPMDNPYLRVMAAQSKQLLGLRRVKGDRVMALAMQAARDQAAQAAQAAAAE
jgi:phage terminase small subunit